MIFRSNLFIIFDVKVDHVSFIASYEKLLPRSGTKRVTLNTENCIMKVIQVYNNDTLQYKPHWYQFTRSDFNNKFKSPYVLIKLKSFS